MKFLNKCVCIILVLVNIILIPLGTVNAKASESNDELHAVWISYLEFNDRLRDPDT